MSKRKITASNILHNNKSSKINVELLYEVSSDNVSDAMKNLYNNSGLIKDIKPINNKFKVVGKIKTAKTDSYDWGTCIKAIYNCDENDILLIDCSDSEFAVWGELASTAAKKNGLKATIINGASRDTEDIIKIDYPVFSKNITSKAGKAHNKGILNARLNIDEQIILNGDYIIADRDGVVVIPNEKLEEVLHEVYRIKEFESECANLLDNNKQLDDILNI